MKDLVLRTLVFFALISLLACGTEPSPGTPVGSIAFDDIPIRQEGEEPEGGDHVPPDLPDGEPGDQPHADRAEDQCRGDHFPANFDTTYNGAPSARACVVRCVSNLVSEGQGRCRDHCPTAHTCPSPATCEANNLASLKRVQNLTVKHGNHHDCRCWTKHWVCPCQCVQDQ